MMTRKKTVVLGVTLGLILSLGLYAALFPEKRAYWLGTNNSVVVGKNHVEMRNGWFAYDRNSSRSVSFVKGGLRSIFAAPGHVHIRFMENVHSDFRAGAIKYSSTFRTYPWGEVRLLKDEFFVNVMKLRPAPGAYMLYAPRGDILIEVLELTDVDGIEQIRTTESKGNATQGETRSE